MFCYWEIPKQATHTAYSWLNYLLRFFGLQVDRTRKDAQIFVQRNSEQKHNSKIGGGGWQESVEEKAFISGLLCPQIKNCRTGTYVDSLKVSRN